MALSRAVAANYLIIRIFIGGGGKYCSQGYLCICVRDIAIAVSEPSCLHSFTFKL